mmetsp:Transcript_12794/g.31120  ORF Transcript_12794/g.31120 Transcript_12794/m.31120 type:complete len:228 (+) Transcript_12794:223-906(+)
MARQRDATRWVIVWKTEWIAASSISSTSGASMPSPSKMAMTTRPYWNGFMPILDMSTACDGPIFSPAVASCTLEITSMVPLVILVATPSAWKKPVWVGSRDVTPGSRMTSTCASEPALAAAVTLFFSRVSLTFFMSSLVNTRPTLRRQASASLLKAASPVSMAYLRITYLIIVFFPMMISALGDLRSSARTTCICCEPTLSADITRTLALLARSFSRRAAYEILRSL